MLALGRLQPERLEQQELSSPKWASDGCGTHLRHGRRELVHLDIHSVPVQVLLWCHTRQVEGAVGCNAQQEQGSK